jgi:hypothetical protein
MARPFRKMIISYTPTTLAAISFTKEDAIRILTREAGNNTFFGADAETLRRDFKETPLFRLLLNYANLYLGQETKTQNKNTSIEAYYRPDRDSESPEETPLALSLFIKYLQRCEVIITYDDEYYDEASVFSVWLINYQPIGDPSPSPEDTK